MKNRLFLVIVFVLWVTVCFGQSSSLQITSPASGTMVSPGQKVSVSVSADPSVSNIGVIGENPLGFAQMTADPLQFFFVVPAKIGAGPYQLTAVGAGPAGLVLSSSITLDVEPLNAPVQLLVIPAGLPFTSIGEVMPLSVLGSFSDDSRADLSHSLYTSYSSTNPNVAAVDANGIVTSVGPGSASILVSNSSVSSSIPVTVSQVVSGAAFFYPDSRTYRATFSVSASGPSSPLGWLKYYYARTRMNMVSTGITAVSISGNTATISGTAAVNTTPGYTFTATVTAGSPGSFGIVINKPDGSAYYSAGPMAVSGGSLTIL